MGGFSYPNEFSYEAELIPEAMGTGVLGVFFAVYLLFLFFVLAFSVVLYIFQSLGVYTLANRRGIRHPWLAWIPFGFVWILGSISDQYQYVAKGKVKNRRKLLLGLGIGAVAIYVFVIVVLIAALIMFGSMGAEAVSAILLMLFAVLVMWVLAIISLVYQYMCLYDLYNSCQPSNGVLYLVLSILFPVTMPFFVFACRKKDLGMPPRKQLAPQQVVVPTVEVVVDPNVVEKVVVPTVEPVVESAAEPVAEGFASPEEFEEE